MHAAARARCRETATMKHVALLRAINVGGRRVKMDQLRAVFEQHFDDVTTFIASGNVIFQADAAVVADPDGRSALEAKIEKALHAELGYDVATFIRTMAELDGVLRHADSLSAGDADVGVYVAFLKHEPERRTRVKVRALGAVGDRFDTHGREVYWIRAMSGSAEFTGTQLERVLSAPATMRNATSLRKLIAKHGGE